MSALDPKISVARMNYLVNRMSETDKKDFWKKAFKKELERSINSVNIMLDHRHYDTKAQKLDLEIQLEEYCVVWDRLNDPKFSSNYLLGIT